MRRQLAERQIHQLGAVSDNAPDRLICARLGEPNGVCVRRETAPSDWVAVKASCSNAYICVTAAQTCLAAFLIEKLLDESGMFALGAMQILQA